MDGDKKFCAICEAALGEGDLDAVCRECYRKAKAPPERAAGLVEITPQHLFAIEAARGAVNLLSWLATQAMERKPGEPPKPPLSKEESQRRIQELRDHLKESGDGEFDGEF